MVFDMDTRHHNSEVTIKKYKKAQFGPFNDSFTAVLFNCQL